MRVTIYRSGGIGGLRLGGTIDSDELSGELSRRAAQALRPQRLEEAMRQELRPGAADLYSYEVTLVESGVTYTVTGSPGAGEIASVLDELVSEIIQRQR